MFVVIHGAASGLARRWRQLADSRFDGPRGGATGPWSASVSARICSVRPAAKRPPTIHPAPQQRDSKYSYHKRQGPPYGLPAVTPPYGIRSNGVAAAKHAHNPPNCEQQQHPASPKGSQHVIPLFLGAVSHIPNPMTQLHRRQPLTLPAPLAHLHLDLNRNPNRPTLCHDSHPSQPSHHSITPPLHDLAHRPIHQSINPSIHSCTTPSLHHSAFRLQTSPPFIDAPHPLNSEC